MMHYTYHNYIISIKQPGVGQFNFGCFPTFYESWDENPNNADGPVWPRILGQKEWSNMYQY